MVVGVVIAIIVLIAIYVLVQYNSFVKLNNRVREAFSTMDVYLKKRWDLIPNIVETVKDYAKHESQVLEDIVKLRNSSYDKMSLSDKIETNQQLSGELSKIEDEIANSRKYYNAVVRNLNTKVEMFPSNVIAKMFNFKTLKMFESNETERNNVKVQF